MTLKMRVPYICAAAFLGGIHLGNFFNTEKLHSLILCGVMVMITCVYGYRVYKKVKLFEGMIMIGGEKDGSGI